MQNLYLLFLLLAIPVSLMGGPIATMATENPDTIEQLIQTSDYAELRQFVEDAYDESQEDTASRSVSRYVYLLALSGAGDAFRFRLASDVCLSNDDVDSWIMGAQIISESLGRGTNIADTDKQSAKTHLKKNIAAQDKSSDKAFEFSSTAAEALIFLHDDSGLDMLLSNSIRISNISSKDGWSPSSEEAMFVNLKETYLTKAEVSDNPTATRDRLMAKIYELCSLRRASDVDVSPIAPAINLDSIRK